MTKQMAELSSQRPFYRSEVTEISSTGIPVLSLFYHRPIEDYFHGETAFVRFLVKRLGQAAHLTLVCPLPGSARTDPRLVPVANVVKSWFVSAKALVSHRDLSRADYFAIADVYVAPMPLIWAKIARRPVAFFCSDVPTLYARSLTSAQIRGASVLRVLRWPVERLLLGSANLIVVRTPRMIRQLQDSGIPDSKLVIIRHPATVGNYNPAEVSSFRAGYDAGRRVLVALVANCEYAPNQQAVQFVIGRVVPAMARAGVNASILLIGRGSLAYKQHESPFFKVLGQVDDLSTILYASDLGIAPTIVEGGASSKVIDYLGHGLPALATPEAAAGIEALDSVTVTPLDNFASALLGTVEKLSNELVERKRGPSQVAPDVARLYLKGTDVERFISRLRKTDEFSSEGHAGSELE